MLAASLFLYALTLGLKDNPLVPIGPGYYPRIVLGVTIVLALALVAADLWSARARTPAASPPGKLNYAMVAAMFAVFGLYCGLLPFLGFRVSTFLYLAASNAMLDWPKGARGWLQVLAVALIRPWLRRPWAHIEHWNGVSAPESVGRLWYAFRWLRRLLGLTDFVGGVTGELTRCLEHFAKGKPSAVVPCVVENPEPIPDARPEGLHLVALGGLIPRKNPLLAVDVVAALRERHPEVTMRWVGDGPQRAAVAARIAELGLGDVVTLVGNVPPERRFREFAPASLYFLPTTQENFFTSAAEALSAGLPVVAARVGGFTDFADASNSVLIGRDEMRVQPFVP